MMNEMWNNRYLPSWLATKKITLDHETDVLMVVIDLLQQGRVWPFHFRNFQVQCCHIDR